MKSRCIAVSFRLVATFVLVGSASSLCCAQSAILSEIYGRGVHAYHSGQYDQAAQYLNMAIDNGLKDPRAYYFRGLVAAAAGRGYEAEGDFRMGAELEARGGMNPIVGRSLARVQGSTRLQLEMIREQARLQALAVSQARSDARYGELGVNPAGGAMPPQDAIRPNPPTAIQPRNVTPPPPPTADNPFQDDLDQDPVVETKDAFENAMDIAEQDQAGGDAAAPAGDMAAPTADDPFGNAAAPSDPFGAPDAGAADPFGAPAGDDPFGAPSGDDPFGGF